MSTQLTNTIPFGGNLTTRVNKKQLPTVQVINKEDYNLYKDFIQKCTSNYYNHTYRYSSEPNNYELNSFFNWLQSDRIFLISKENRNLGYVVLHNNDTTQDSVTSFSYFVHPSVCKLNSVTLSYSGFILATVQSILYGSKLITTYVNHSMLSNSFNYIFDTTKQYVLQPNLIFISVNLEKLKSNEIKDKLYSYFTNDTLDNYFTIV